MARNNIQRHQKKQMKVLYMATLILFLPIFVAASFFFFKSPEQEEVVELPEETVKQTQIELQSVPTTASSAIVVSLNDDKVLYQKFPDRELSLASITKLVTAKVAGDQTISERVSIEKMEPQTYGDARLSAGEQWKKKDLISYTLVTSSNDGAHSLSANMQSTSSFVTKMNTMVASIGLANTKFYNETGLDDDDLGIPGSKGTAKDVSKLLSYLVKNDLPLYEETKYSTAYVESPHGTTLAKNTNEVTNQITGLLMSKTGYTDTAGGNLAIVADMGLNEPTAFVVLHSSKESRFDDVLRLQKEYFAQVADTLR